MATILNDDAYLIEVPATAHTLEGFRQWTYSDDFPDRGKITFVEGRLLIDMSPERYESHVKVKAVLTRVLANYVELEDLGDFYPDGGRVINKAGAVSNEPDAVFASWDTLQSGRLAPPADRQDGKHIDLVGTPDWVCEVVSDSSEEKDTIALRQSYHAAGIPEYWLIDARDEDEAIDFQILVWTRNGYSLADTRDDWQFSPVFRKWFKLIRSEDRLGRARYELLLQE